MHIDTNDQPNNMPVVQRLEDFDRQSGNWLERLVFNRRLLLIIACLLMTVFAGWQASRLRVNAGFEKMIPKGSPYIQNYLDNRSELRGLGNSLRIVVETKGGTILEPGYLETLRQLNDELFLVRGVDRAWMKSLWTPAVRWNEVTEEGFSGGPVMPPGYDGSPASLEQVKLNIARAGITGSLVGNDLRSSMLFVPLLERDSDGKALDYASLSGQVEKLRLKYERQHPGIQIHIIGFAKLVGDLIDGLSKVMVFFLVSALLAAAIIYGFTRCLRSTVLVVSCSVIAVVWQLGLVTALGYELDPYSILVPFLVFAIGVSHGAQKMNGVMQDIGRGTHRLVAARYTFRRLFLAGLTALMADVVGFAVLMVIDIPVIKELAIAASIGVGMLVFTNLLLLPVLLSYFGVSPAAAARTVEDDHQATRGKGAGAFWETLGRFTERRWASAAVGVAAVLTIGGLAVSAQLKIGDLDPGAPELRKDSRYNLDNAYITANYSLSSDVFAVIVKTPRDGCSRYETLVEADRLAWSLAQLPSVQATSSLAQSVRQITAGSYEGNLKWMTLARQQDVINYAAQTATTSNPDLFNVECTVMPVIAFLKDHKAATLEQVATTAETFAAAHGTPERTFLLAAGSAGIEAATNMVVKQANHTMLLYVYAAVIVLCFITFRSWRAVLVAVIPLMITSILCEALMVWLGMGVKVATLPVIALGVGIGVDYALYLLSVQLAQQRHGLTLAAAYRRSVQFTGKVVALVGVTLAVGVITWAASPIKFQADMGILLTFMFVWNMVGALVLIPALSHFLLRKAPGTPTFSTH